MKYNQWVYYRDRNFFAMGGLLFGINRVFIGGSKPFYQLSFQQTGSYDQQGWSMGNALFGLPNNSCRKK